MKGDDRKQTEQSPGSRLLQRLVHAPAAWAMVWPAALVIGGYVAWQNWGVEHVAKKYYSINRELIHVTAKPEYIDVDIADSVYVDTRLDQLSFLDPTAAARIASAFSFHPWVRKVVAVRKLPGGEVDIHLEYRKPVAMVFVISRHPEIQGRSFFAVDQDGVLLPTTEFSRQETMKYMHIEIPDVYPTGGVGSQFGDSRVTGAAGVAAVLEVCRDSLPIRSIQLDDSSRTSPIPQYKILAADGRNFFWGSSPGEELYGEPLADEKIRQLLEIGARMPSTDQADRSNPGNGSPQADKTR